MKAFLSILFLMFVLNGCGGSSTDSGENNNNNNNNNPPPVDTTPPAAPSNFEGISGDSEIELLWSANSESDFEGYNIYRSDESFSSVSGMSPLNGNTLFTETEYIDDDVENGTTYYYRLTAVDENGNESSASSIVEKTPFASPPSRPS